MLPREKVFERQGYGRRLGFGTRAALLIVDFQEGFRDVQMLGSPEISEAVERTRPLLDAFRRMELPVAYTRHVYGDDLADLGLVALKVPTQDVLTESAAASAIVPELAPRRGELVVRKRYPSAFFDTDLAGLLRLRGVDTLVVAGCSTSGCVHASVVDAMGCGFRPLVVRECVGDRHALSHDAALLNMDMKYGDVMALAEVLAHLGQSAPAVPEDALARA
jgi:maleamate amidohydrolase